MSYWQNKWMWAGLALALIIVVVILISIAIGKGWWKASNGCCRPGRLVGIVVVVVFLWLSQLFILLVLFVVLFPGLLPAMLVILFVLLLIPLLQPRLSKKPINTSKAHSLVILRVWMEFL